MQTFKEYLSQKHPTAVLDVLFKDRGGNSFPLTVVAAFVFSVFVNTPWIDIEAGKNKAVLTEMFSNLIG